MPKFVNTEMVKKKQEETDKDMLIADLTQQLAEAQQQMNDMSLIVADLQAKMGGTR